MLKASGVLGQVLMGLKALDSLHVARQTPGEIVTQAA